VFEEDANVFLRLVDSPVSILTLGSLFDIQANIICPCTYKSFENGGQESVECIEARSILRSLYDSV